MATCKAHNLELFHTIEGGAICPACEAQRAEEYFAKGLDHPVRRPGVMAVPVEGTELKPMTIRLRARDIERAKVLAKSHRMLYQPYLRKLLVSALDAEEKTVFRTKRDRPSKGKSGLPRRTTSS